MNQELSKGIRYGMATKGDSLKYKQLLTNRGDRADRTRQRGEVRRRLERFWKDDYEKDLD